MLDWYTKHCTESKYLHEKYRLACVAIMLVVVSALDPEFKNSDVFIAFITAFSRCYGSVRFSSYDATRTNMFINKSTKLICQGFTGKQVFTCHCHFL